MTFEISRQGSAKRLTKMARDKTSKTRTHHETSSRKCYKFLPQKSNFLDKTIPKVNLVTRLTLSDLDPTDFRRSPDLSPEFNFGTVAAKRVSSSDTSNSDALGLECNHQ